MFFALFEKTERFGSTFQFCEGTKRFNLLKNVDFDDFEGLEIDTFSFLNLHFLVVNEKNVDFCEG